MAIDPNPSPVQPDAEATRATPAPGTAAPDIAAPGITAPGTATPGIAAPSAPTPPWPERVLEFGTPLHRWVSRPRVRLALIGALLLIIGGLMSTNSVWTLPLVLIGALMVVIAWIGHRLDGRFIVEWGAAGTQLSFRAQIKAAQPTLPEARGSSDLPATALPRPGNGDIVEGEAHTVEIDVADLRALLAAAETAEPRIRRTDPFDHVARSLRVAARTRGSEAGG